PSWAKILEKTYGLSDYTKIYEVNGKEIIVPIMMNKKYGFNILSSMLYGYGGFFSKSHITSDDIKNLIHQIIGGRNIIFDFTIPPLSNLPLDFEDSSIIKLENYWTYTQILPLKKGFEYIWSNNFNRRARRSIKKAKKNDIEIRKGDSLDDFKDYYYVYSKSATEKWDYETPPESFDLYKNIYKYGLDLVDLYLAQKDDEVIAGYINLNYGKNIFMYGGAFLSEYGPIHPSSLIYGHIIESGCNEGYEFLNMGSSGDISGVKKFKENFGPDNIEISRFNAQSIIGRLRSKIYK
ncbi:MAG: GNAT family N-acetyltransferase, partial [Methanobacterium sp.]